MRSSSRRRRPAAACTALRSLAIFLALLGAPGCTTSGADRPEVAAEAVAGDSVQRVTVALHSFYFEPDRIVVRKGLPVEMVLQSRATLIPHNLTLHAADAGIDIDQDVGARKRKIVRFTPTRVGEFPFACGKGSHMEKGMTGVLVVRD